MEVIIPTFGQKSMLIEKELAIWLPVFSKIKSPQSEYLDNVLRVKLPTPSQFGGEGRDEDVVSKSEEDIVGDGVEVEVGEGKEVVEVDRIEEEEEVEEGGIERVEVEVAKEEDEEKEDWEEVVEGDSDAGVSVVEAEEDEEEIWVSVWVGVGLFSFVGNWVKPL